jgi:arginase
MARKSDIQIVSAPSILGLQSDGVEKLPAALLSRGLQQRLHVTKSVVEIPTLNHLRSSLRDEKIHILNWQPLRNFSIDLRNTIKAMISTEKFMLVLGGDCSILIGIMSALKSLGTYGLFFVDAHADFYEPEKSITGEAADMDLAIVTGRGPDTLTNINDDTPYVKDEHVIHIGQRDWEETKKFNSQDIRQTQIKCFNLAFIEQYGIEKLMNEIDSYIKDLSLDGFWIHFDTDVLDDNINPAVDYRIPGGLSSESCERILSDLIKKYSIVGMSVTIFNSNLDNDGKIADGLTALLSNVFRR